MRSGERYGEDGVLRFGDIGGRLRCCFSRRSKSDLSSSNLLLTAQLAQSWLLAVLYPKQASARRHHGRLSQSSRSDAVPMGPPYILDFPRTLAFYVV